ncbi:hypothetical protein AB0O54_14250 [Pseudarthrobacter oxydans]|uniref:hypothetical protein n=1 Tax=Pseudarthrobacter oxydans TaxID=1671 RepID=UPI003443F27F
MVTERAHFLGRADILRELVDGTAGHRAGDPILTARSPAPGRVGTSGRDGGRGPGWRRNPVSPPRPRPLDRS